MNVSQAHCLDSCLVISRSHRSRPPARDLMPGTCILFVCHFQINGQDVQNRKEAVAALSRDECTSIVLLVARPETQVREDRTAPEPNPIWVPRQARRPAFCLSKCSMNDLASTVPPPPHSAAAKLPHHVLFLCSATVIGF